MLEYKPESRASIEEVLNDKWFNIILGKEKVDQPLALQALTNLKAFRVNNRFVVINSDYYRQKRNFKKQLGYFWCHI